MTSATSWSNGMRARRESAAPADDYEEERTTQPTEIVDAPAAERCVLVEIGGARGGKPHGVVATSATVGRSRTCDVCIDDETLSRVHARVQRVGDDWTIEDSGSRNGSFVNGVRVAKKTLRSGDRIRLGASALLRFDLVSVDEERALVRQYESGTRDQLTGLYNRKLLDERLRAEIAYATRHATEVAVAMIDVDHFKRVNDTYGHLAGDAVLRHVAETTVASVRAEDTVARYGGEELVVVTRGIPHDGVLRMAERIRVAIERASVAYERHVIRVTASVGIASLARCRDATAISLLDRADQRLYRAKHAGRNRVVGDDG